jgi:hypothetical protein
MLQGSLAGRDGEDGWPASTDNRGRRSELRWTITSQARAQDHPEV